MVENFKECDIFLHQVLVPASVILGLWEESCLILLAVCRRLYDLPHEANRDNHSAAAKLAAASEQIRHEAEIAALGLAILVRLTSHAGAIRISLSISRLPTSTDRSERGDFSHVMPRHVSCIIETLAYLPHAAVSALLCTGQLTGT